MSTPAHRLTSRLILMDEEGRVLLFNTAAPDSSGFTRWYTPGGGVDPGETHAQAAVRELWEETGLKIDDPGEPVWSHDFETPYDDADHDTGHAEYYVIRTPSFEPSNEHWTDSERIDMTAHVWWSAGELLTSGDPFEPADLPRLIRAAAAAAPDSPRNDDRS